MLTGKEIHGMSVQMIAEDFAINRLVTSAEIKTNYLPWVAKEIFAQAAKVSMIRLGFVPKFVSAQKDWSEFTDEELACLPAQPNGGGS